MDFTDELLNNEDMVLEILTRYFHSIGESQPSLKSVKQMIDRMGKYFTMVRIKYPKGFLGEGKINGRTKMGKTKLKDLIMELLEIYHILLENIYILDLQKSPKK